MTGNDGYLNFLAFAPKFISLIVDANEKVTNWISTGILSEKIKLFGTKLEPAMSNLSNGRVILKFHNFALVQKNSSSLYTNFILNL